MDYAQLRATLTSRKQAAVDAVLERSEEQTVALAVATLLYEGYTVEQVKHRMLDAVHALERL